MRVLIVGSGGREHALAWKVRQSPLLLGREDLLCVPGNAGTESVAVRLEAPASGVNDAVAMADLAAAHGIDLVIVGPEAPLIHGLADELGRRGMAVFGCSKKAARLEGSKVFAKQFMARHGIPTAPFEVFASSSEALEYLSSPGRRFPLVVKADGIAAGKGVVVAQDLDEAKSAVLAMMEERRFGPAGEAVVIEDCLIGTELSFFALSDGGMAVSLGSAQDHKRVFDGDRGPNTGGMGACSPSAEMNPSLEALIMDRVIRPTVSGMAAEGTPFRGVLFAGIMLVTSAAGPTPMVLEFNARLGDPETQALVRRLDSDLLALLAAAASGDLRAAPPISWNPGWAACVVAASRGYPQRAESGRTIVGLEAAQASPGVVIFHGGTEREAGDRHGAVITAGGRVLAVSAMGARLEEAVDRAYRGMERIQFDGMHYRRDIAAGALRTLRMQSRSGGAE